jgi:hypothetical protein
MNAYYKMKSHHKGKKTESEENIAKRVLSEVTETEPKKEMISEGRFHFERGESQDTKRGWRFPRMRLWYWFLLILFLIGFALVSIGEYYMTVAGEIELGWELSLYGAIPLGVLGAIGLLYLERWWRRHMRKFWGDAR